MRVSDAGGVITSIRLHLLPQARSFTGVQGGHGPHRDQAQHGLAALSS